MQKRLSVARALLMDPPVLLVDEATHDLDPEGARTVQRLALDAAARGVAVIWATQRVDEIRGFADGVTLLDRGEVRFAGTVAQLMARSPSQRFLLRVRIPDGSTDGVLARASAALGTGLGAVAATAGLDSEHIVLSLGEDVILGDALAALTSSGIQVLACREERSEIEEAFLRLIGEGQA
jgi:ABC-2 type transport system ATP-binding protein